MKAARLEEDGLRVTELPAPVPGAEEALIRVSASGVCHSDLHLVRRDWHGGRTSLLGHEAIGVVETLGPGAERFTHVGDRVILGLGGMGGYWCGACEHCLRGDTRHCDQRKGILGTFAEQICVWAGSLVTVPDEIGDHEAPLACGGLTAYGAVKKLLRHQVPPGRPVAVIGAAGGLGHYAVQLATLFGYRVVAVDLGEERLEFARSLGAVLALEPHEAVEVVRREFGDGVDAALVFSARLPGFQTGLKMLRRGGLFVAVGLPPASDGNLEINPFEFFFRDPTLIYSAVGTVQDMRELVDLVRNGLVRSHVSRTGRLTELPAIFEELEGARYLGRAVVTDLAS
jgi:propanol-preferring alcohol dehydrogenase